jgi:alkylhydroperoxidase family enzyme
MMSRIAALTEPFEPEVADLLAAMMPRGVAPIGLFRTFARNPVMARAMTGWGGYELGRSLSLSVREREIVIDRTCARCGCEYEWGVHVAFFAERAGLSDEQVRSLTLGSADDACWASERERLVIRACDALHDRSDIDDDLWAALARHLDERELMDLLLLAGWYHAICYVATAARVDLEPFAPRFDDVA